MAGSIVARVLLDTNVLKAARDSQLVFLPRTTVLDWGHCATTATVHDIVYENQNAKLLPTNRRAFDNRLYDRLIARIAKEGAIEILISHEVLFEAMGVPGVDCSFFGSPRTFVRSPVRHFGCTLDGSGADHLFLALKTITEPRFLQLQRLTGAYQGRDREPNRNQLLDAFHLWCGETAGADYLLTHDVRLIRMWTHSPHRGSCEPIDAFPLVKQLLRRRVRLLLPILSEAWAVRRSGRRLARRFQLYADVAEGFTTRKSSENKGEQPFGPA